MHPFNTHSSIKCTHSTPHLTIKMHAFIQLNTLTISIYLSIYLSIYISIYLSIYLYLNHILITSSSLITSDKNFILTQKQLHSSFNEIISSPNIAFNTSTSSSWRAWHSNGDRLITGGGVLRLF